MKIVILEDNVDRISAMRHCLAERFARFECRFFDEAVAVKNYREENLADTILIALDHDLDLKPTASGEMIDPGTGREVADYLAGKSPVCPVIIHTTNTSAAIGMEMVLKDARWKTYRVIPFDDLAWVPTNWVRTVRRAIARSRRREDIA